SRHPYQPSDTRTAAPPLPPRFAVDQEGERCRGSPATALRRTPCTASTQPSVAGHRPSVLRMLLTRFRLPTPYRPTQPRDPRNRQGCSLRGAIRPPAHTPTDPRPAPSAVSARALRAHRGAGSPHANPRRL